MNDYKTNKEAEELISLTEEKRLEVYICPAGKRTIGRGHVLLPGENFTKITNEQEETLFQSDLRIREKGIRELLNKDVGENLFSALVSLVFNIGINAFKTSTLLRNINSGIPVKQKNFVVWKRMNGKVTPGLIIRRIKEYQLATTGTWNRNINKQNYKNYLEA